jgi:hypothetical protein
VRSLGVEVVGEGIGAGLQFFDCVRQVVDGVEFVPPGRLGAFDAAIEVWPLGGQDEEFEAAPLASSSKTDLNSEPPSAWVPEILKGAVSTILSRRPFLFRPRGKSWYSMASMVQHGCS